ncbi:M15 family metallopeptidase [Phaeocystidibacter marisrubri]|nr:M15 family metallopeptidase [Phaeocystidibacter marisrubri]
MSLFTRKTHVHYLLFCAVWMGSCTNHHEYKYGITPIYEPSSYIESVEENRDNQLVELDSILSNVVLDIRYATANNFTESIIYTEGPGAFVRLPVAHQLVEIEDSLEKHGLGIVVFDAYRPYSATVKFYEVYGDTNYVASPYSGSRHNRGCAVDLSLYKLADGRYLNMPTDYDDFSIAAHPSTPLEDSLVSANRDLLIQVMEHYGFTVYPSEWWHFDYTGWEEYKIMDLSFPSIREQNPKLKS